MPDTPFVPKVDKIVTALAGDFGISQEMLGGIPNLTIPSINDPGLPSFIKTIMETSLVSIQPILTVVGAVGGIITAMQELTQAPPTEWVTIFNDNIVQPIADTLGIITVFLPPTIDSLSGLILTPITQNIKLPNFFFPSSSISPLSDFPDIALPIPAFNLPSLPPFPTISGDDVPPMIKMLLGIISVPLDMIMKVFSPIKAIFDALTDPTTIPDVITELLDLPNQLFPNLENIVAFIKVKINIPDSSIITTFIEKIGVSFVKIIGWALGFEMDDYI